MIPKSLMYASIQSARYPLSPPKATGHAIGVRFDRLLRRQVLQALCQ